MRTFIEGSKVLVIGWLVLTLSNSLGSIGDRLTCIEQAVLLNASAVSFAGRVAFAGTLPKGNPAKTFWWQSFAVRSGGTMANVYGVSTNDVSVLKLAP